jgi:mono/diheme cytochrome c family protein
MSAASSVAAAAMFLVSGCATGSGAAIEPQDPELVAAGADLYAANCGVCPCVLAIRGQGFGANGKSRPHPVAGNELVAPTRRRQTRNS